MSETTHIPVDSLLEVNRTMLVRQWWYLHGLILKGNSHLNREFVALCDELTERGIIKNGVPMPRDGAEDLAREVDEILQKRS